MGIHGFERRFRSDRRANADRAPDLHRRIEEKRQQFERRQRVRRAGDGGAKGFEPNTALERPPDSRDTQSQADKEPQPDRLDSK